MKRILALLTLVIVSALSGLQAYAANDEGNDSAIMNLMQSYEGKDGVEFVNLNGLLLTLAKPSLKGTPMEGISEGMDNMCVFTIGDKDENNRKLFEKDLNKLLEGYEKVLQASDKSNQSSIYIKRADESTISEILITANTGGLSIVLIKGSIPISELEEMAAAAR